MNKFLLSPGSIVFWQNDTNMADMQSIRRVHRNSMIFWALAMLIVLRSLVVPGLTPVSDEDSPLGFNITFCENLFELPGAGDHPRSDDGHDHSHGHQGTPAEGSGSLPASNHCSVAFMGGIFIELPSFDIERHLVRTHEQLIPDYSSPYSITHHYRLQQSRAPPISRLI